ncbi:hypothetical protein SNE40_009647 [Patella caerulea]|uniref:Uncharacterized protein n=1 Tax=Patella caerulea TaxID=87958 RepID=A0AAN8JTU7_PATCE
MFLNTLGIGEWAMHAWVKNDKMGFHENSSTKTTPNRRNTDRYYDRRQSCTDFLAAIPKLPSHYCRSSSTCMYLEPIIGNKMELYRLYCEYCVTNNIEIPASRRVLMEEMQELNIKLFQPKKDKCDICSAHEVGNVNEDDYNNHVRKKEEARDEKIKDKTEAENGECNCISIDLQAVLIAPRLQTSSLYYKQKLAVHNFTVFDMVSTQAVCYVFDECQADLTANVFASCLTDYIKHELPKKT